MSAAADAEAILCYQARVDASLIRSAPALRLIQKHGLNTRNIDVEAATERSVPIATMPLMRSITVAEHALALMLTCARRVIDGHRAVTQSQYRNLAIDPVRTTQTVYRGNWARIQGLRELHGATVGVVGMGDIGMEIAKRCRAFGMSVLYFQRTRHSIAAEAMLGLQFRDLDGLLAEADYVVLAIPHTPQTEGIIDAPRLALMRSDATLINIGRGGLIDEDALFAALREQRIAMAGLDVYRIEPLPPESPLLTLSNVVLLPHLGGGSHRSWEVDMPRVLGNIERHFASGTAEGIVNA